MRARRCVPVRARRPGRRRRRFRVRGRQHLRRERVVVSADVADALFPRLGERPEACIIIAFRAEPGAVPPRAPARSEVRSALQRPDRIVPRVRGDEPGEVRPLDVRTHRRVHATGHGQVEAAVRRALAPPSEPRESEQRRHQQAPLRAARATRPARGPRGRRHRAAAAHARGCRGAACSRRADAASVRLAQLTSTAREINLETLGTRESDRGGDSNRLDPPMHQTSPPGRGAFETLGVAFVAEALRRSVLGPDDARPAHEGARGRRISARAGGRERSRSSRRLRRRTLAFSVRAHALAIGEARRDRATRLRLRRARVRRGGGCPQTGPPPERGTSERFGSGTW